MFVNFLNRYLPCMALLSAMFMVAGVASAAHIPITIDSSTPGVFGGEPEGAIDGSGLDGSEPPQHLGGNTVSEYFLVRNNVDGQMDATFFVLDLNGTYDVDSLRFWNMNATGGRTTRGYTQVNIAFSSTDNLLASFGAAQSFLPGIAPGTAGYTGELFPLTTAVGAKYALLTFGDGSTLADEGTFVGSDGFAGFSEIQLYSVIPEPTTLSLLALSGLAMVGLRRRRV